MTVFDASPEWRRSREEKFLAEAPDSLGDLLSNAAEQFGEALAIDLFDRGQKLSFAEWDSQATRLAHGLHQFGVHAGVVDEDRLHRFGATLAETQVVLRRARRVGAAGTAGLPPPAHQALPPQGPARTPVHEPRPPGR